jgi:hypothetical protein
MVLKESKLLILEEVEKWKGVLFGAFNESLMKQNKVAVWQGVYEVGKSHVEHFMENTMNIY